MKLIIRDRGVLLIRALMEQKFDENVTIELGDIFAAPADAVVSPANSFGYMDGGIDKVYCEKMGWHLHEEMQQLIKEATKFGELLVGEALVLDTKSKFFPSLICAPTMRLPGAIPIHNVFLATRAAVYTALHYPRFKTVVMPGMGTGTGRVTPEDAAQAMAYGYHSALKFYKQKFESEEA
jgi:O-acetyl-ADP-ribose deacetylase (regulator of RNase III)